MAEKQEPATRSPILGGLVFALIFIGFGIWMIVQPDIQFGDDGPSGRKSGLIFSVLRFVWGMPGGIVSVLLGALFAFGAIKGGASDEAQPKG